MKNNFYFQFNSISVLSGRGIFYFIRLVLMFFLFLISILIHFLLVPEFKFNFGPQKELEPL